MTMFIFIGDMLVMAFMIGLAVWVLNRDNDANIDRTARIPLEDEAGAGFVPGSEETQGKIEV